MDEDGLAFIHGLASAVAASSVWEVLRAILTGWALLVVGATASGVVFHFVHRAHNRARAKLMAARHPYTHRAPPILRRTPTRRGHY